MQTRNEYLAKEIASKLLINYHSFLKKKDKNYFGQNTGI